MTNRDLSLPLSWNLIYGSFSLSKHRNEINGVLAPKAPSLFQTVYVAWVMWMGPNGPTLTSNMCNIIWEWLNAFFYMGFSPSWWLFPMCENKKNKKIKKNLVLTNIILPYFGLEVHHNDHVVRGTLAKNQK